MATDDNRRPALAGPAIELLRNRVEKNLGVSADEQQWQANFTSIEQDFVATRRAMEAYVKASQKQTDHTGQ